jgi:hypothetical protein
MLSLTKKSDADPAARPQWHPNFRNFERLPDTKVVRTTFFVNTAAIGAALCLLLWLGYREYHIHSLREQIADANADIASNLKQNTDAIRLSQLFSAEERKLTEAMAFLRAPISLAEYINILGESLPKEISIEFAEARMGEASGGIFILRGLVAGTPDQASGTASSYVDTLRAHPRLGSVFNPITLTNLNRDAASGFLSFEILLKVKGDKK